MAHEPAGNVNSGLENIERTRTWIDLRDRRDRGLQLRGRSTATTRLAVHSRPADGKASSTDAHIRLNEKGRRALTVADSSRRRRTRSTSRLRSSLCRPREQSMLDAGSRAVLDPASPTEFEVRVSRDPMRGRSLVSSKPPSTIDTTALDGALSAEGAQALPCQSGWRRG